LLPKFSIVLVNMPLKDKSIFVTKQNVGCKILLISSYKAKPNQKA
jgi:hypothetical protein